MVFPKRMASNIRSYFVHLALVLQMISFVVGLKYNFSQLGGLGNDMSEEAAWSNGGLFNRTLLKLKPGDTLLFPNTTFYMMGGIVAEGLRNVTLQFDGTILFSKDMKSWPRDGPAHPQAVPKRPILRADRPRLRRNGTRPGHRQARLPRPFPALSAFARHLRRQ